MKKVKDAPMSATKRKTAATSAEKLQSVQPEESKQSGEEEMAKKLRLMFKSVKKK